MSLAVWIVVYQLYAGMELGLEQMILRDCSDFCGPWEASARSWALRSGLDPREVGACACFPE